MVLLLSTNMAMRKHKLKHSMDLPLAVDKDSKGKVCYRTRAKTIEVIRRAVKTVYPEMSKDELSKYSSHSFRVWTCVTLDEQGMSPDFIKKRLRWPGESYRVYLTGFPLVANISARLAASRSYRFLTATYLK